MTKITGYSNVPGYTIVEEFDMVKGGGKTRLEAEKKMLENAKKKNEAANAIINLQVFETTRHNFMMSGFLVQIAKEKYKKN